MFSLIFYCGIISSVASAHFNDTSLDGDQLNINTTLFTLASTTIPVSKDCVLEMKENEISQIVELFSSNLVNTVVIHISFANNSHNNQLLSDFRVSLLNPIGREILYALEILQLKYVTWTLKAGIRNLKLNVNGSQNDCIKTGKNATDFALESTQHIVDSINLVTNYEVCSSFKETSSGKVNQTCCQMTKPFLGTGFKYKCSQRNSFLFGRNIPWSDILFIATSYVWICLMRLLLGYVSHIKFDLKYPQYYQLEESVMSPSSILFKITCEENGRIVSFFRSWIFVGVCSYCIYLTSHGPLLSDFRTFLLFIVGLLFTITSLYRSEPTNTSILKRIEEETSTCFYLCYKIQLWLGNSADELCQRAKSDEFTLIIKMFISPFNIKLWRKKMKMLYSKHTAFIGYVRRQPKNRILRQCTCLVFAVFICFLNVCFTLFFLTFYPYARIWSLLYLMCTLKFTPVSTSRYLEWLWLIYVLPGIFLVFSFYTIMSGIHSFLLGLFLNLIYFIPYFAFFSVLTFYCCTYWKTMEEKYFVLKRIIYEECRKIQYINNGCTPNRHPEPNEDVIPVVSKVLYDKIREELLPYDTNLFYFGLKMLWAFVFSFSIFKLINLLNEFNLTGLVQIVTTASLGVMPHILNTVTLKMSKERKKAWNEKLKMNVRYMVEKLIGEDPELARTVLIIQENDAKENDNTATDENNDDSEHVNPTFELTAFDNNGTEELDESVVIDNDNNTTFEESIQQSERFEGMFGINFSDDDEVEDDDTR